MMQAMNSDLILWPKSGTYILAVSGGRDSMVLLDVFARIVSEKKYNLEVAHFDHKMRPDSAFDASFVEAAAGKYSLKYIGGMTEELLTSEDAARTARYNFLYSMAKKNHALGIITAHHQDDLIETSLLNLARGSGRKGLVPFESDNPLRPFSRLSREDIDIYSKIQNIEWREDSSNQNLANPRNFLRHALIPNQYQRWSKQLLVLIDSLRTTNESIDKEIKGVLHQNSTIDGFSFPKELVAKMSGSEFGEIIVAGIKNIEPSMEFDRRLVEELVIFANTGKVGKRRPLRGGWEMLICSGSVDLIMISIPATKS